MCNQVKKKVCNVCKTRYFGDWCPACAYRKMRADKIRDEEIMRR